MQRKRQRFIVSSGSSKYPLFIGGPTTTTTTPPKNHNPATDAFCENCSDWLKPEGWQEDGTYFCPTCLEFRNVELVWRPGECLVHDISKNFS